MELPHPKQCFDSYPHLLSGGMRQRVVIAMALLCEPDLLIADEPTTALDVTLQAHIMQLLKTFYMQNKMAIVLITHDLPLALNFCDRVAVMYAGRIIEIGKTSDILYHPQHPYTQALLAAAPQNKLDAQGRLHTIQGTLADPLQPPNTRCAFKSRCAYADKHCEQTLSLQQISLENGDRKHQVACFHPLSFDGSLEAVV
jgi:oligopeptide/dipeptide ABC transporter ATP-binding protein